MELLPTSPTHTQGSAFKPAPRSFAYPILMGGKKVLRLAACLCSPVTDIFTQGLADFLGLQTLRHGTTWRKYYHIQKNGLSTHRSQTGASLGLSIMAKRSGDNERIKKSNIWLNNSFNKISLCHDSSTVGFDNEGFRYNIFLKSAIEDKEGNKVNGAGMGLQVPRLNEPSIFRKIQQQLFIRTVPRFYAWHAGIAAAAPKDAKGILTNIKRIASGCINILSPTVRVRYAEIAKDRFSDDRCLMGSGIQSDCDVDNTHLGISGIFKEGMKGSLANRIRKQPVKSLSGLVRLINPLGIYLLTTSYVKDRPYLWRAVLSTNVIGVGLLLSFGLYYLTHKKKEG